MLRVTQGSCIANAGRCFTTGSSQSSLPCWTRRASTAAVIALLFDAILNSVAPVTGWPLPATVSPWPRAYTTLPSATTPTAIPGNW